jgi:hypothetical protein
MCVPTEVTTMEPKDVAYIIGITFTAIIGMWNLWANTQNNKKTSFINTVTSERVKWLEKLRNNISTFAGLTHTWTRNTLSSEEEKKELLKEIDKLRYLIRLQLNPKFENNTPNVDKRIEELIAKIPNLTADTQRSELDLALEQLVLDSQELLKNEWEKVKDEAKNGNLKEA